MKPIRSRTLFRFCLFIICLAGSIPASAQTTKPFLWRIEGPVPSYLYGTVHVPDPRVLDLPEVVRKALDSSDVFTGEIPLDSTTQFGLLDRVSLPPGQDLRKLVGEDVFARIIRLIGKTLGTNALPGMAEMMAGVMSTMKPWAVMSQLELLEFLPDITAGRQPLDSTLYAIAEKSGKELGALETVEEQIGVFEGFTMQEQVQMLVESLEEMEKPRTDSSSPVQDLIKLYLDGDLDALAADANKELGGDSALDKKMAARVVDERNNKMVEKIADLVAKKPARSYFFAVGALHYAGDTGILRQLEKKGFRLTRLNAGDAATVVRKPAA